MKKTFALATLAFVAATDAAGARGATTISLNDFCDVLTIQQNKVLKTALRRQYGTAGVVASPAV